VQQKLQLFEEGPFSVDLGTIFFVLWTLWLQFLATVGHINIFVPVSDAEFIWQQNSSSLNLQAANKKIREKWRNVFLSPAYQRGPYHIYDLIRPNVLFGS